MAFRSSASDPGCPPRRTIGPAPAVRWVRAGGWCRCSGSRGRGGRRRRGGLVGGRADLVLHRVSLILCHAIGAWFALLHLRDLRKAAANVSRPAIAVAVGSEHVVDLLDLVGRRVLRGLRHHGDHIVRDLRARHLTGRGRGRRGSGGLGRRVVVTRDEREREQKRAVHAADHDTACARPRLTSRGEPCRGRRRRRTRPRPPRAAGPSRARARAARSAAGSAPRWRRCA